MSYTRPSFDVADASWVGAGAYTRPAFNAADASFAPPPDWTTDLVFEKLQPASTDLVFGGDGDVEIPRVDLVITGSFAPLTVSASFVAVSYVEITGSFTPLTVSMSVQYRSNTSRPTVGQTSHPSQSASHIQVGRATGQQDAISLPRGWTGGATMATGLPQPIEHLSPNTFSPQRHKWSTDAQQATRAQSSAQFEHQSASRAVRAMLNTAFENASLIRHGVHFPHQDGTKTHAQSKTTFQPAMPLDKGFRSSAQAGTPLFFQRSTRFQEAVPPPPGLSIYVPPVVPPPPSCYDPSGDLVFGLYSATVGTNIVFICDGAEEPILPITVPVRRVYIVLNNVSLRRVSDNALVPALTMTLSLDAQSWTWGFDATLPGAAQAQVEPTSGGPVELKATVNGTEFRVFAENVSRERTFGRTNIRVSGKGRNAVLDAPYTPQQFFSNTADRTSQQLMDDVLTFNGVSLGYTIDYGLEPWLVPEGVWNHQGTYISALAALAQAGGGYLIPHPSNKAFKVRHRYPTKPWETITPDFILPPDVFVRESVAWKEKPAYNRVYVSGQEQGVLGRVTRAGTAGDVLAPMVTDPLITTAAAARQRGLAVLGDTCQQLEIGLSLPVLSETGILQPGMYVQYADGGVTRTGIVRSTNVTVGEVEVKQTLGVEVHA